MLLAYALARYDGFGTVIPTPAKRRWLFRRLEHLEVLPAHHKWCPPVQTPREGGIAPHFTYLLDQSRELRTE